VKLKSIFTGTIAEVKCFAMICGIMDSDNDTLGPVLGDSMSQMNENFDRFSFQFNENHFKKIIRYGASHL